MNMQVRQCFAKLSLFDWKKPEKATLCLAFWFPKKTKGVSNSGFKNAKLATL